MKSLNIELKADASLVGKDSATSRILEIELTTPESNGRNDCTPLNLALVIDRSGSMSGNKLQQAKEAAEQILGLMRAKDSVSVIAYDDVVEIVAEADSVTTEACTDMSTSIKQIRCGGSTNLSGGWLQGCECVARHQLEGKINRTLLLTDGLANVGITSAHELSRHAAELFERGVATSTFGIGTGYNERLLEGMANRGGGNYYFIESADQIPGLLMEEFHDLAAVTIKNTVLEVNLPDGVKLELFGDWKNEQSGHKTIVHLSDLPAKRRVTLYGRLLVPPGNGQLVMNALVKGINEEDSLIQAAGELSLQYASQSKVDEAPRDRELLSHFATVAVGQLSNEALLLERQGMNDEAVKVMEKILGEFGQYLPAPTLGRYSDLTRNMEHGLNEYDRKTLSRDTYLLKKHRHPDQSR